MILRRILILASVLAIAAVAPGCTSDDGSGTGDTGTSDTGTSDTGTSDTGTSDTGTSDTGDADVDVSLGGTDEGSVEVGDEVHLNAHIVEGDGPYTIEWAQVAGTTVNLADADTLNPSFTAPPSAGDVGFELTVSGATGVEATQEWLVHVVETPAAPSALTLESPGDITTVDNVVVGLHALVAGDSTGIAYQWTQTAGSPNLTITSALTADPTVTIPLLQADANFEFTVQVTNTAGADLSDTVGIDVSPTLPTALAGNDIEVFEGESTGLNGAAVGGDTSSYTYEWSQTAGTTVSLSDKTLPEQPFVAPDVSSDETLTFELEVTDGAGHIVTDTVDVLVRATPGAALAALAGPDGAVVEGHPINLRGSAQGGTDPYTYQWVQTSPSGGPTIAEGKDATFPAPIISGSSNVVYVYELTVTDSAMSAMQATDAVSFAVRNMDLTATAEGNKTVFSDTFVDLSAVASGTGTQGVVTYHWEQTSGPGVPIADADQPVARIHTPAISATVDLVFEVTVEGDGDSEATDTLTITVIPPTAAVEAGLGAVVCVGDTVSMHGALPGFSTPYDPMLWAETGTPIAENFSGTDTLNPTWVVPTVSEGTTVEFSLTLRPANPIGVDFVVYTILPTDAGACQASSVRATCSVCTGLDCLLATHVQVCADGEDVCTVNVSDTATGRAITRACADKTTALAVAEANLSECDDIETNVLQPGTSCQYVCDGANYPNCNKPPTLLPVSGAIIP